VKASKIYHWWLSGSTAPLEYIIPASFPEFINFSTTEPARIFRQEGSEVYTTDYDFDFINDQITGNTAYVDLENGSNAAAGTIGAPWKTMVFAVAQSGYNRFYVKGQGITAETNFTVTKNIAVIGWPGEPPPKLAATLGSTWVKTGGQTNVWQMANPVAPTALFSAWDQGVIDANGMYVGLTRRSSIALVDSNAGSYFYDSGSTTMYVSSVDGRAVDSLVKLGGGTSICVATASIGAGIRYLYVEGVHMYGGGSTCVNIGNTGAGTLRFGFKDCVFNYAAGSEAAVLVAGRTQGFFHSCKSYYNRDDCFDYRNDVGLDGFTLEWYCEGGKSVGTSTGGTSVNGSTGHFDAKIMRVGCDFQDTNGKPVQDINNSLSYNLGVIAGNGQSASPNNYAFANDSSTTGTGEMWLIECQHAGASNQAYQNFANGVLHIYDGDLGNLLTGNHNDDGVGAVTNILTEGDVFV
jgi:hypothetical protein